MRGRRIEEGGFTLLEILTTVVIVGILAAIAFPMFLNQPKTANDSALKSAMKTASAFKINDYQSDHAGNAPPSLAAAGYYKPYNQMMISIVSNELDYCLYGYVEGSDEHTRETPYITYNAAEVDVCPISGSPHYE